jgi:hypothetical protein
MRDSGIKWIGDQENSGRGSGLRARRSGRRNLVRHSRAPGNRGTGSQTPVGHLLVQRVLHPDLHAGAVCLLL